MLNVKLSWSYFACLVALCSLAFGLGLGSSKRLTYHEAFVAQGAREIVNSGHWWHPTIGGLPWLEKPPLPFWLVASLGWCVGEVSPLLARLPSAIAGLVMVLGVTLLATRHYGSTVGMLSGAIQATTAWTVIRARLAEADILLACLLVWTLLAFDRIRVRGVSGHVDQKAHARADHWQLWRWAFFVLLAATALVKGTGFGAVLGLSVIALVLLWDGDQVAGYRLLYPGGWIMFTAGAIAWPLAMITIHGFKIVALWVMHITERVGIRTGHGTFAGESWHEYGLHILAEALPWTPLAVVGAWQSLGRAWRDYSRRHKEGIFHSVETNQATGDRLLWCWAVTPLVLVSLASARNAHYAIYALVPWSIWAALSIARLGCWQIARGWSRVQLRRLTWGIFGGLAAIYGLSFWLVEPWFDRRGAEWAFYEAMGHTLPPTSELILLYDDWDREAYPTPFGPIPHDLAVRLFYLNRSACWHYALSVLVDHGIRKCPLHHLHDSPASMMIISRDRDLSILEELGQVGVLSRSSAVRWDRIYLLVKVQPRVKPVTGEAMQSWLISPIRW